MKWSRLSIGRQIGIVAVLLSVLLAAIIMANVLLVIGQGNMNWQNHASLIHEEAVMTVNDQLGRVKQLAGGLVSDPTLLQAEEEQILQQRIALLKNLCPIVIQVDTSAYSEEPRTDTENPFSNLIRISELSGGSIFGVRYTHWGNGQRVQLQLSAQMLSKLLPQRTDARTMVLDRADRVIACTDFARVATEFSSASSDIYLDKYGQKYIMQTTTLSYGDYRVVTLVSGARRVEQQVNRILPVNFAAMFLMAIVVAASFYLLHISVSKPIGHMMDMLTIMRKRPEARIAMTLRGNREMMELSRSFNKMMDENERLNAKLMEANVRLYKAELVRKQTDMAMLVSQINPHFLYNTLEVIKGMAYRVGSRTIVDMTRALGSVFRYSLKAPELVSLQQEVDVVKNYMTIQLTRFGDRFQVHYDLPEELMAQDVLKMVLQPLCENAITHGLEMMEKGGHLYISARLEGNVLYLVVEDNGLGIDEESLRQVREKLDKVSDVSSLYEMGSDGLGLVNVHGRIRMRYGEQYGLTIDSQQGQGTRVELRMPGRRPQDCIKY